MTKIWNNRAEVTLILVFAIWIFILSIDYYNKHPQYYYALKFFRYPNISIAVVFSAFLASILLKFRLTWFNKLAKNITILISIIFFVFILGLSFTKYSGQTDIVGKELLQYLYTVSKSIFGLIFLTISAYLYGYLPFRLTKIDSIVRIGLGLAIISFLIFLLCFLNVYTLVSALALLCLPYVVGITVWPKIVFRFFTESYNVSPLNVLGLCSSVIVLFYLTMNFVYIQAPFPVGFDSRNFYMNIARLVSINESLVFGYKPYNWALIISLGYKVFDSSAVALSLSFYGYLLSFYAYIKLGTKYLKLDLNVILFLGLLITVSPAITNQLYVELKTDFGLLFFQIIAIILFCQLIKNLRVSNIEKFKSSIIQSKAFVILLGVILGFGIGIKLTNIFLIFSLLLAFVWIVSRNILFVIGCSLATIALFILAGMDDMSGLSQYHDNLLVFAILLMVVGIGMIIKFAFQEYKTALMSLLFASSLGLVTMLSLSPWLLKNAIETNSLNPSVVLNGAYPGPGYNLYDLMKNLEEVEKNN